tara:strand:- start:852 stop:3002 length:2151 start_codon:yes stop_codon:yes gene_type:complete
MQFFVVSAGQPGEKYMYKNFEDILSSNEFALHPDAKYKVAYSSVETNDVLILKFDNHFVAYGIVQKRYEDKEKNFSLRVKVREWIKYDVKQPSKGITTYGIQNATIGGGQFGTIKIIDSGFGLEKIREINDAHTSFDEIYKGIFSKNNLSNHSNYINADFHEELFNIFYSYHLIHKEFKFKPRRTNRFDKLNDKFWFLGDNTYLCIGFWEGNDYKKRLPYISLIIENTSNRFLYFTSSGSSETANFLCNQIFPVLDIDINQTDFSKNGFEYHYYLDQDTLIESINYFLNQIWKKINDQIKTRYSKEIKIISDETFYFDIEKIKKYRNENKLSTASKIKNITIVNYGPIKTFHLGDIPENTQFIFLTGENATGKSSILKALTSAITGRKINKDESLSYYSSSTIDFFQTIIFFHTNSTLDLLLHREGNTINHMKIFTTGFAAYGPMRLQTVNSQIHKSEFENMQSLTGINKSLFELDGYLLNLESQFDEWFKKEDYNKYSGLSFAIKEFLESILMNAGKVEIKFNDKNVIETLVFEKDDEENLYEPVGLEKLSSGYSSILGMMGDMIVRLLNQQPNCTDLGELTGIVIIDEIDIHLHPKFQKHLVEQLAATFPKVQFIVSTHSPIPLLGAPKNSVICVVKRSKEKGTYAERVDDQLELENMLPNTILSSPIFGFKELFPVTHNEKEKIRTEDTFEELKKNDELKAYLKTIAQKLKNG